jgi:hypothetical protein
MNTAEINLEIKTTTPKREKRGRPPRALGDSRRELFCQHVASGVPVTEAYTLAGYEPNPSNPGLLRSRPEIDRRIAEIVARRAEVLGERGLCVVQASDSAVRAADRAAEKLAVTVESLLGELEEVRAGAMKEGQFSAAVAAIKEKGVLAGVRIERSEQKHLGDFDQWSLEDLHRELLEVVVRGDPQLRREVREQLLLEDQGVIDGEAVDGSDSSAEEVAN